MQAKFFLAATAALTLILFSSGGLAHRDATGIVKQRMDAMEDMARAMKGLRAMMRGRQPYDAERVKTYARVVAGHGAEKLTVLFPEGSLHSPTRAKPAIWADWERFAAMARELTEYAGALTAAASNERRAGGAPKGKPTPKELATMAPDAVFTLLQKNCSDCHRMFRERRSDSSPPRHDWADRPGIRAPAAAHGRRGRVAQAVVAAATPASSAATR